jgi:hypothetical protein
VNVVKELINYPSSREQLVREGQEYIKRFSDDRMATMTMDSYRKAIDDFNQ